MIDREVETSALHPDVDSKQARRETVQLDYRESAGVLFARRSEKRDLNTGEVVQTVVVKALTVNPAIDPSAFRKPIASSP